MNDHELEKNLRRYCAFLLMEHGIDISPEDPLVPPLYIMHKQNEFNIEANAKLAKKVDDAIVKLNPTVFNFYSGDAALKFQVGKGLKWMMCSVLALIFLAIANWHWSMNNDIEKARDMVNASGRIAELIKQVRKDEQGNLFIDFKLAEGDSIRFSKNYVKVDSKTVRVYVAGKAN